MDTSQMKNIIILKNIPSNIVEEAIVVLKPNKKVKQLKYMDKSNGIEKNTKDNTKEYIIKEAEMIISTYINNIENKKNININGVKEVTQKYKRLKLVTFLLVGIVIMYTIISIMPIK